MGILKQHLLNGVSPDTKLFSSMFLIWLLPSMREAEGAGNHKTAVGNGYSCVCFVGRSLRPRPYGYSCHDIAQEDSGSREE
jgi:hypothetical protein